MAKKKRKLNTPFVIALSAVVLLVGGAFIAWKVVPRFFPQVKWIVRGTGQPRAAR